MRTIVKSLQLLGFLVGVCCVFYPIALLAVGQILFPFQANGSMLNGTSGEAVGSRLVAQPFTRAEFFHPRPSAVAYDAAASGPSSLAASNYVLRDRVARQLGPMVLWREGPRAGQRVGPDIETWFRRDVFQGQPHIVAQWATMHPALAQVWTDAHAVPFKDWLRTHALNGQDPSVAFLVDYSVTHLGSFPCVAPSGAVVPMQRGEEIQATFFDMWRQDHPHARLADIPADMVTTSGSGLDPHITLRNAQLQLGRVASCWAAHAGRDPRHVRAEIELLLRTHAFAPWNGLAGEKLVNVLEVNLALVKHFDVLREFPVSRPPEATSAEGRMQP